MLSRAGQAACVAAFGLLIIVAVATATVLSDRIPDTGYLLRDNTTLAEAPWWVGSVARVTNLGWAVAATLNVVAGLVAPRHVRRLLLSLGALTCFLAIDDTLLLHDSVLPGRGVPELLIMIVYGSFGLALGYYWLPLRRTAMGAAFFTGAGLFMSSVLVDRILVDNYLLEDGAKILGVLAWNVCGAWAFSDGVAYLRSDAVK